MGGGARHILGSRPKAQAQKKKAKKEEGMK